MNFNSLAFLLFLPLVVGIYWLLPQRPGQLWLLCASYFFYMYANPSLIFLLLASTLIDYLCSNGIERRRESKKYCRFLLLCSIFANLGLLFTFKYFDFFGENWNLLAQTLGLSYRVPKLGLILPVGISFYTFQTMSYSIDVFRGQVKAEHNIIDFGAYVVMFPQLIAGPIVKYRDVSEQLHVYKNRYSLQQIEDGVCIFVFGLAKKVLLADTVSKVWTDIIGVAGKSAGIGLANASTPLVWLGVIAYSMQLYFDFSGYSMMAIGMGKMLGFNFPSNFNMPYISRSITEFWRRWHITLSSWFRDYVYIPLGGNRKGLARQILNMFIVWLLTGIWHGADWNFVCWGLYYFVLLTIEKSFLLPYLEKGKVWPHIYTLFLVVVGWAMFVGNEQGVGMALLFQKLFIPSGGVSVWYYLRNYAVTLIISAVCCSPLPQFAWDKIKEFAWIKVSLVISLMYFSVCYIVGSTNSPFLYFNF